MIRWLLWRMGLKVNLCLQLLEMRGDAYNDPRNLEDRSFALIDSHEHKRYSRIDTPLR